MDEGEPVYKSMDYSELAKSIFARVQKLEPENVVKIFGCIFLKEPGQQEIIQLAFGPEVSLLSKISDAKAMLGLVSSKNSMLEAQYGSYPPSGTRTCLCANFHPSTSAQYWDSQLNSNQHIMSNNFDLVAGHGEDIHTGSSIMGMEEGSFYYDAHFTGSRTSRRSHSLSELPVKPCHYFNKGYCKNGVYCKYSHAQSFNDGYRHAFRNDVTEFGNEDYGLTPVSLEKLEMEITELLRAQRGMPISIASLPMLYYDKYGRHLQAEGYLTESQRHRKAGLSLTKLLNRLKNSIRVIDRPHGQHAVILAEDAPRYIKCRNGRNDLEVAVPSSHQIYLTFPPDSKFTEEDVSNYFQQFGQVRDVRIPSPENRMFGFVSFVNPEPVKTILMKRVPHFICGARVLVKPYREKSRGIDRSYQDKTKPLAYYTNRVEMDHECHTVSRELDNSRLLYTKQLMEEQEKMALLERMHFSELNLAQQPYLNCCFEDFNFTGPNDFFINQFSHALDALNIGLTTDEDVMQGSNSYDGEESCHIELPDSPFASPPRR